jgi:hypothetical protein
VETTDVVRMSGINKTRRLLTVNHFVKVAVEKGILDIKLTDRPITGDSDAEDEAYGFKLGNRTKGLVVVDAWALRVATDDPTSFATSKHAIRVELMAIDPLADDDVGARCARNK